MDINVIKIKTYDKSEGDYCDYYILSKGSKVIGNKTILDVPCKKGLPVKLLTKSNKIINRRYEFNVFGTKDKKVISVEMCDLKEFQDLLLRLYDHYQYPQSNFNDDYYNFKQFFNVVPCRRFINDSRLFMKVMPVIKECWFLLDNSIFNEYYYETY